jgi:pilus assembly protein FimV
MAKPTKGDPGMYRKSALTAALLLISASSQLHALGLGEIDMQSALNQPMEAVIELTSAAGADLSKVNVTLASQAAHQRIGLSRSRILNDFDFNLEKDSHGNTVIRISSHGAIHEPFLEFLLELTWPNGHLLREYTVLVDPPITMPARPARPVTPVSRVPASTTAVQTQARQSHTRPAPAVIRSSAPALATSADNYGPIRRNDTLWSIAERLRPDNGISIHQMMLALQRENPQAFIDNNINNLKAGATLNVPSRDEILSLSTSDALTETAQQYSDWKEGTQPPEQDETTQEAPAVAETEVESEAVVTTESRLQLMAPEDDAVEGSATAGDPVDATGEPSESSTELLNQQLAMAAEEAETSKVQSAELQSQVSELEEQLETMARLLELKDEALASMQQQLAADAAAESAEAAPEEVELETVDETIAAEEATAEEATAEEATAEDVSGDAATLVENGDDSRGIVNKLMDNPLLAGLGVLVALLLGGFLWSSTRQKNHSGIFADEMTLDKHLSGTASGSNKDSTAAAIEVSDPEPEQLLDSEPANDDSDPVTEADVYLAYGRIQQAEDVLQAALAASPDDSAIHLKLLEVYHAAGNVAAFNREASDFREGVNEEDAVWMQIASMGHALAPDNDLYRAVAVHTADADIDFDMDLSDMENLSDQDRPLDDAANDDTDSDLPESREFNLDEAADMLAAGGDLDEEDVSEGLLSTAEEVTTKLDLARAYLDMGDPEGARSILGEVMEEGNDEQKNEAEVLISKIA